MNKVKIEELLKIKFWCIEEAFCMESLKPFKEQYPNGITAKELLNLNILAEVKLMVILREDFFSKPFLHEFACRCAERALLLVDTADSRSINAIAVKRKWLKGEATDAELSAALSAARDAAFAAEQAAFGAQRLAHTPYWTACAAAWATASAANAAVSATITTENEWDSWVASHSDSITKKKWAASAAAWVVSCEAIKTASAVACKAAMDDGIIVSDAMDDARHADCLNQIEILKELLEED